MAVLDQNFVKNHSWNRVLNVVWEMEEDGYEEVYVSVRDLEDYLWCNMRDIADAKNELKTEYGDIDNFCSTLTYLDGAYMIMWSLWKDIKMRWHFEINDHFHC